MKQKQKKLVHRKQLSSKLAALKPQRAQLGAGATMTPSTSSISRPDLESNNAVDMSSPRSISTSDRGHHQQQQQQKGVHHLLLPNFGEGGVELPPIRIITSEPLDINKKGKRMSLFQMPTGTPPHVKRRRGRMSTRATSLSESRDDGLGPGGSAHHNMSSNSLGGQRAGTPKGMKRARERSQEDDKSRRRKLC